MLLDKIISGGQTGADQGGLAVGKAFGFKTGGLMPLGFKTLTKPRPEFAEKYGVTEHTSSDYAPRTEINVKESDGTVRLAADFNSRGEICTLKAIKKYDKPCFDVDLTDPPLIQEFIEWLDFNNIKTLNVAGNSEQTYEACFRQTVSYLSLALFEMGFRMTITRETILSTFLLGNDLFMFHDEEEMLSFQIGKKTK